MYYVIDAVRWRGDGQLSHVRWHPVMVEGEQVRHGEAAAVDVVAAGQACASHEVRVFVDGAAGRFFRLKACPEGLDAEADDGTPLRQRLAHLPTF